MNLLISDDCISCGRCVEACPALIIGMEDKKPKLVGRSCIECGHCEAICPVHALENDLLNHDDVVEIEGPVLQPDQAELFLRSRRSMRCFKDKIVSEEETKKLLKSGTYAQTGSNSQGVSYIVVSSKEKMESLRKIALEFFKNHENPQARLLYKIFTRPNHDVLFRGAPMCILALTAAGNSYTQRNAQFALTYVELFAPTLGLGTCWAGYLEQFLLANTKELHELLDIPSDLIVSGALLYGYPKYKYHRTTQRNELKMESRY